MHAAYPWDIFCKVIDNYGDIGVCWRLCVNLAERGQSVRLWVDDASALSWMAPQGCLGVQALVWDEQAGQAFAKLPGSSVVIEAFGCELPHEVVAHMAQQPPVWINLEYLSAEAFVQRCHGLISPVMSGPGAGMTKHFFYPGFTPGTGGLLCEADLLERQRDFDRSAWLAQHGVHYGGQRLISLFCYEPTALKDWLVHLSQDSVPTVCLVAHGRAQAAVKTAQREAVALGQWPVFVSCLELVYLPPLTQRDFDHVLWACDLNFVRGEDSLVRGLWAGKPMIWQIYPQDDDAHHRKLGAFLDHVSARDDLRLAHRVWNGIEAAPMPPMDLDAWQIQAHAARAQALQQVDLATQLLGFAEKAAKIESFASFP